MKKYLLLPAFLLFTVFGFAQNLCQEFKTGTYTIKDRKFDKVYTINRKEGLQTESDNEGTVCQFTVNWVNDCTYELRFDKTISSKEPVTYPEGFVITTKITKKTRNGYKFETSSNLSPMIMKGKATRKTMKF
jgi:hypothetical protein